MNLPALRCSFRIVSALALICVLAANVGVTTNHEDDGDGDVSIIKTMEASVDAAIPRPRRTWITTLDDNDEDESGVQLKIFWNVDDWLSIVREKKWCAACYLDDCDQGNVVLRECDKNDPRQRWVVRDDGKISPRSNSVGCLSYRFNRKIKIDECAPYSDHFQRFSVVPHSEEEEKVSVRTGADCANHNDIGNDDNKFTFFFNGKNDDHNHNAACSLPDCVSPTSKPHDGDRLHVVSCKQAERHSGAYWEIGVFEGHTPSAKPSASPTDAPSSSSVPSSAPTVSARPSATPSSAPSDAPSASASPSASPIDAPSAAPSLAPSSTPSRAPSETPTISVRPTATPSFAPSATPSLSTLPSSSPTGAPSAAPSAAPSSAPSRRVSSRPSAEPSTSDAPSLVPTTRSPAPTTRPSSTPSVFDTNDGFFNDRDVCEKRSDGSCPCYPKDDDWYCDADTDAHPWILTGINNAATDHNFERCDESRFPTCLPWEKLCPMRKPRLNRFHNGDKRDVYYYIDYDCIKCVPRTENCSKCSPGIWCEGIKRCVGPDLFLWCKTTFPDYDY